MDIDNYIRSEIHSLRAQSHVVEPSQGFVGTVMNRAYTVERQRRARINIWFAVIALSPYAARELWSLIRHDYFSLSAFPLSSILVEGYHLFMSSFATYILVAFGIVMALYFIGLPKWRMAELRSISRN